MTGDPVTIDPEYRSSLREAAEKATPVWLVTAEEPYDEEGDGTVKVTVVRPDAEDWEDDVLQASDWASLYALPQDAAYLALVSPEKILALLTELEVAERTLAQLDHLKDALRRTKTFAEQLIQSNYGDEGERLADSYRRSLRDIASPLAAPDPNSKPEAGSLGVKSVTDEQMSALTDSLRCRFAVGDGRVCFLTKDHGGGHLVSRPEETR